MSPGWYVDGIRNWTKVTDFNFSRAWSGVVSWITDSVTMPDVYPVDPLHRNMTYPRYKAPHVDNQNVLDQNVSDSSGPCALKDASLPGSLTDQPEYGCTKSCRNGCMTGQPSIYNPGPSFANATHSVNLIRVHKATVHFTCVRALLVLKRERLDDPIANEIERHTYTLARVLMKPQPGPAFESKRSFVQNIQNGLYSREPIGFWKELQTGTTGLRSMDVSSTMPPNPGNLKFTGVTQASMLDMPGQMLEWME